MKRILALLMGLLILLGAGGASAKKNNQMATDLPPWDEEHVRSFLDDYISGTCYEELYACLDLQVQRYMPMQFFKSILTNLYFISGDYVRQGSYHSFENEDLQLKTHVVHMVMEKQDLDLYLTTKDRDNDWEIMAVEFVPSEREEGEEEAPKAEKDYTEKEITIGSEPWLLGATITLPEGASAADPAPVCVLLHDDGPYDRNLTRGSTALFADMAALFAEMGIATIRYDKRTFTYPDAEIITVEDDVVEDAIAALGAVFDYEELDSHRIFVLGLGFGGMEAARVITESGVECSGLLILGGTAKSKLEWDWLCLKSSLSEADYAQAKSLVQSLEDMKEEKAAELTVFGKSAYYYWEMLQTEQSTYIRKLKIPTCIIQSREDGEISRDDGLVSYQKALGKKSGYITWLEFRNLNHLLMKDLSTDENGKPTYTYPMHLDKTAGADIANWILEKCH